ncbi:MAG: XdhC family protein, partial [Chitinophagaceae bacterium]
MNRKELNAIVKAYHQQVSNNHAMVLATVVGIEGSAFRGLGAKMLITDEGNFVGAISGGCLEKDTVKKALWVIQHQQPQLITYDTLEDDDLGIGVALGCNGVIDILLEPIHAENELNPIALIETAINTNEAFILATFFTKEQRRWPLAGTKLVKINAACVGKLPPFIATFPENLWQISYQQKEPIIAGLNTKENNCFVLLQFEPPPLQLYLAGAGNDAFAVANLALQLGWQVHIVSQALSYHWQKNETDIQLHNQLPAHFFQTNKLPENACVVLLTHSFPKDLAALQALLPQSFR